MNYCQSDVERKCVCVCVCVCVWWLCWVEIQQYDGVEQLQMTTAPLS